MWLIINSFSEFNGQEFCFLAVSKIIVCLTIDGGLYLMTYDIHRQPFLQEPLVLFSGGWCLESKTWAPGVLSGIKVSLPGPLYRQSYVYIHKCTYEHEFTLLCQVPAQHHRVHGNYFLYINL